MLMNIVWEIDLFRIDFMYTLKSAGDCLNFHVFTLNIQFFVASTTSPIRVIIDITKLPNFLTPTFP